MTVEGSVTRASAPTLCSKKIAAIGLTYSWLKRQSVFTKPLSPARTHGTPNSPFAASTTQCRAKIFSAIVIGRREAGGAAPEAAPCDSMRGSETFPWSRATLYSNRPPYSMISRVIGSMPAVNTSSGICSPSRIRSISEKSVEVSTPRFWQFSL